MVRLGGDAQRILSLAAVIGRDFDLDLVMAASRSTEDEVLNVLDEARPQRSSGSWTTLRDATGLPMR